MAHLRVLAAFALCGCQIATAPSPPLGDSDAAAPAPRIDSAGTSCAFGPASALSLPPAGGVETPFAHGSGSVACTSGDGTYDFSMLDMTGDLLLDLVVTRSCTDSTVRPSTAWLVYPNTSSSFGAPVRFVLPMLGAPPACFGQALVDVNGDRRPDLLLTSSCIDATIGTSHWFVYLNTPTGFELTPRSFSLPAAGAPGTFAPRVFSSLAARSASCGAPGAARPAYAFFDVTGDLKPDLVVTTACDDPNVGVSYWRVYPSDGAGLGAPFDFPLPPGFTFAHPEEGMLSCRPAFASPHYFVVDFNGDFAPDLVVTESCTDPSVGVADWLVYPSSGSSFAATPQLVSLPRRGETSTAPFDELEQTVACATGATLSHSLVDVDGDFKPDLVLTRDCLDATVGVSHWLVLHNRGAAFDAPAAFALPTSLGATSAAPATFEGELRCGAAGAQAAFEAEPFLGPELDLVITATCGDPSVGAARWLVLRPSCAALPTP